MPNPGVGWTGQPDTASSAGRGLEAALEWRLVTVRQLRAVGEKPTCRRYVILPEYFTVVLQRVSQSGVRPPTREVRSGQSGVRPPVSEARSGQVTHSLEG